MNRSNIASTQTVNVADGFWRIGKVVEDSAHLRKYRASYCGKTFVAVHYCHCFYVLKGPGDFFARERSEYAQLEKTDFFAFFPHRVDDILGGSGSRVQDNYGDFGVFEFV